MKSHQHGPGHGGGLTSRVPASGLAPVQARQTHLEGKKANKGSWVVEGAGDAWGTNKRTRGPGPCLQISERHRVPCSGPEGPLRPCLYQ